MDLKFRTARVKKTADSGSDIPPRFVVRLAIAALALATTYFAATATTPATLPSVALHHELVYRGELFLMILYGGLLVATPVLRGLLSGLLPTEITARGAKYDAEQVSGGLKQAEERIAQLSQVVEASSGQRAARVAPRAGQAARRRKLSGF
jgi:hypothetical protein